MMQPLDIILLAISFSNPSKFAYRQSILSNAKQSLQIPTYDGSDQVVHPSIIDFRNEYNQETWSGYRYWMVLTPFPYNQEKYENPSLYASHDGFSWIIPPKITNPLDKVPESGKGFFSDPDMIYNPVTDQLWIYYRFTNLDIMEMKLIRINSDLTMEKPVTLMEKKSWSHDDNRYRSLSIWREAPDRWHLWGSGGEKKAPYSTNYFFSTDGQHWEEPQRVVNENGSDPFQALGLSNWHMSARPNPKERRVEFLVYTTIISPVRKNLFFEKNPIVYAECPMNFPTRFMTPICSPCLLPSKTGWDSGHLYRCSFQIVDNGTGYTYKVWYSAAGSDGQWHLGYTEGCIGTSYRKETMKSSVNPF